MSQLLRDVINVKGDSMMGIFTPELEPGAGKKLLREIMDAVNDKVINSNTVMDFAHKIVEAKSLDEIKGLETMNVSGEIMGLLVDEIDKHDISITDKIVIAVTLYEGLLNVAKTAMKEIFQKKTLTLIRDMLSGILNKGTKADTP